MTKATFNIKQIKLLLAECPDILSERLEAETRVMTNEEKYPSKETTPKKPIAFRATLTSIKEDETTQSDLTEESAQENGSLYTPALEPEKNIKITSQAQINPYLHILNLMKQDAAATNSQAIDDIRDSERGDSFTDKYYESESPISPRKTGVTAYGGDPE